MKTSALRSWLRKQFLSLAGSASVPAHGIHILGGHYLSRHTTDATAFRNLLERLQKNTRFIRFEEATSLILSKAQVSEALVAFSFDDGFEECYTHIAPLLEEFGINAAFFINPNFIDGDEAYRRNFTDETVKTPGKHPVSWDQVVDLHRRGHIIGAHTLDHYCINDDNLHELERQVGECKFVIEKKIESPCLYFSFPYGRLEHANPKSIDIACKYYPYIFSQSNYKHYFSFHDRVINRRHFEPDWDIRHVYYFISCKKK